MGRPSIYSAEIADSICERLADGESLRTICLIDGMPSRGTVFRWLAQDDAFRDQYAHARQAQADTLADEIIDIADDGINDTYENADGKEVVNQDVIARSRLRVDARKWIASKLKPKVYGEKVSTELSGPNGGPIVTARELTDDQLAAIARAGS